MTQKNFRLYRGGNAEGFSTYRCDGTNIYSEEFPEQVAAEYAGGYFTLSFPLAPNDMRWQRNAFRCNDAVAAGDYLAMLRIPEKHRVNGVTLELNLQDLLFSGWKFALKGFIYKDGVQTKEIEDLDQAVSLSEKDGDPVFVFTDKFDTILMDGESMVIGVTVVSAKDADERPLGEFNGRLSVTASVQRLGSGVGVL